MASHVRTTIRYDGPALADHEIDVKEFAPALLALAEIIQTANRKLNGDAASMRVLVKADVEQRCFQIDLHLVQSLYEQARTLLGTEEIKTAKEIAEWIGIIGGSTASVFGLIKLIFGKRASGTELQVTAGEQGTTIVATGGKNIVTVNNYVYQLAADPAVQSQVKQVLKPLERAGYESLDFVDKGESSFRIEKEEAKLVLAAPLQALDETENFFSSVQAQVEITTAQFKGNAQWGLWWTGRARLMRIGDEDWLKSFQAGREPDAKPGAWLDVVLEITQPRNRDLPATYVVTKVNRVIPPDLNGELL